MPPKNSIGIMSAWLEEIGTGRRVKVEGLKEVTLTPDENDEIRLSDDYKPVETNGKMEI